MRAESRTPRWRITPSRLIGSLVACIVGAVLYVLGYAKRNDTQLFGEVFNRARTLQRVTALTFDDGPREPDTRALLDVLDREQVRATFFMVGTQVANAPDVAGRGYADLYGMPSRDEIVQHYGEASGRQVDDLDYYVILARWKLGVVLEQGYQRAGDDEKLQMFGPLVLELMQGAADLAESTDYQR